VLLLVDAFQWTSRARKAWCWEEEAKWEEERERKEEGKG
jgi:hypothetical protein